MDSRGGPTCKKLSRLDCCWTLEETATVASGTWTAETRKWTTKPVSPQPISQFDWLDQPSESSPVIIIRGVLLICYCQYYLFFDDIHWGCKGRSRFALNTSGNHTRTSLLSLWPGLHAGHESPAGHLLISPVAPWNSARSAQNPQPSHRKPIQELWTDMFG